jgi:uncharacterized membrane protein YidH (DUF202 family)
MSQTVQPPGDAVAGGGAMLAAAATTTALAGPTEQSRDAGQRGDRRRDNRDDKEEGKRQKAVATADKELLSWTRFAMSLATTGIATERGLAYIESLESGRRIDPTNVLHTLALCLVGLGVGSLVMACLRTWRVRRAVRRGEPLPEPVVSLSLVVAVGVICIFLVALVTVMSFRDVLRPAAGASGPAWQTLALSATSVTSGLAVGPRREAA